MKPHLLIVELKDKGILSGCKNTIMFRNMAKHCRAAHLTSYFNIFATVAACAETRQLLMMKSVQSNHLVMPINQHVRYLAISNN